MEHHQLTKKLNTVTQFPGTAAVWHPDHYQQSAELHGDSRSNAELGTSKTSTVLIVTLPVTGWLLAACH